MTLRTRSIALLLLLVVGACGDDDTTTTEATTTTAASGTTAVATTQLQFTVDGLTGSNGMVLVAIVSGDGSVAGSACIPVDADPFSGSGAVRTSPQDNPCSFDAPFGVLLSEDGTYSYQIATFTPGSQTPGMCATGEVTVDGPTEVTLTGDDFSAGC